MKLDVNYHGIRRPTGCLVTCDGVALPERRDLRNHSPTGFDWGNNTNGAAQLALALLCDFFRDDNRSLQYYEDFKIDFLVPIAQPTWTIKSETIVDWVRKKMREQRDAAKVY